MFVGALLAGAFLVLVGISLAQEFRRRYILEQHVRKLRTDIEAREGRIAELRRTLEYLATDAYVERAARQKLNYQKPGENVVVVPRAPSAAPTPRPEVRGRAHPPVWRSWFALLFGPSHTTTNQKGIP